MAIEQKERYVVWMEDGRVLNTVASTYQEILQMFGEENVVKIEKLDYQEVEQK